MPKAAAPGSRSSIPAPTASAQRRQNHPVTRSLIPWPHPPNRAPLIQTSLNLGIPPVSQALRLLVLRLMVAAAFGLSDMMGVTPAVASDAPTQWMVKDASGRIVEHVSREPDGRLIRSDPLTGQRLGTIDPGVGDRLMIRKS